MFLVMDAVACILWSDMNSIEEDDFWLVICFSVMFCKEEEREDIEESIGFGLSQRRRERLGILHTLIQDMKHEDREYYYK